MKESVKSRLIQEYDRRSHESDNAGLRRYYRDCARRLRARGSGPLPWWAKHDAKVWRIT
jgi:hypothetical protein